MASRLVVDTARQWHSYSLDGETVPSVTGIKGAVGGAGGLISWAGKEAAKWALIHREEIDILGEDSWLKECSTASDRVRDASAKKGRQVHSIAERLVYGHPVDAFDPDTGEQYPDDVLAMAEQTALFMDAWDVTPDTALVERPVFHEELKYAGTFDLKAYLRGGAHWLIDYKATGSPPYPETALQLAGYAHATHIQIESKSGLHDQLMPPIDRAAVLWVRPDKWQLIPIRIDEPVWQVFQHAIEIHRFLKWPKKDSIGAPLPEPDNERIA